EEPDVALQHVEGVLNVRVVVPGDFLGRRDLELGDVKSRAHRVLDETLDVQLPQRFLASRHGSARSATSFEVSNQAELRGCSRPLHQLEVRCISPPLPGLPRLLATSGKCFPAKHGKCSGRRLADRDPWRGAPPNGLRFAAYEARGTASPTTVCK